MDKFGLIGRTLKHSYSKKIHALLGEYPYSLIELLPHELIDFVTNTDLKGYNVTIPYKKDIMWLVDYVDGSAKSIGAVNTVIIIDGVKRGYNTDFDGMEYMLRRANITVKDKSVLILGSGGTSNTARAVCQSLKAKEIKILSRSGEINYQNYQDSAKDCEIIINTTPVGTFPDNYSCNINLKAFPKLIGVADVVYNPSLTVLTNQARELGLKYTNGLSMLVAQAKYAKDLFFGFKTDDSVIEEIISTIEKQTQNVVLVGMPGCGKSSVGKVLATVLKREFIDIDQEIVKRDGRDIPIIFKESGEKYFRQLEKEVVKEVGAQTGKVIATGGGVVKDEENYFPLKQNGVIVWISRDLEKLSTFNRPLSKDALAVKKLFEEREGLYQKFADIKIENDVSIDCVAREVKIAYENFSN